MPPRLHPLAMFCGAALALAAVALGACGARTDGSADGAARGAAEATVVRPFSATLCATCHGPMGEGLAQLRTPSIAGLPDWYVVMQLEKFRTDQRGSDPQDANGRLMHAVALTLTTDAIAAVAETVAALPPHPTRNTLGGDAKRGRAVYHDGCIDCHRYNGSGELAFRSAPLTGLQDWYLVAQLEKFRAGLRGTRPDDGDGAKMHLVASGMSDEQFRDVAAFIAELAARRR